MKEELSVVFHDGQCTIKAADKITIKCHPISWFAATGAYAIYSTPPDSPNPYYKLWKDATNAFTNQKGNVSNIVSDLTCP